MYSSTSYHTWTNTYYIKKYLCLTCGMVHERMDEQQLAEMMENQQYENR